MRSARVSVLLPTLNVDVWLDEAVESILRDGYDDIEVIVLLDGFDVAPRREVFEDPRVRVEPLGARRGIAGALNRGLELARGEYVARMDGDDVSLPGRLRAQVEFLDANSEIGVVGTQALGLSAGGERLGLVNVPVAPAAVRRRLLSRNALLHPTIMFRRDLVLAEGGYDADVLDAEDYDLYLRLAVATDLANLPHPYLLYRLHAGQVTKGFNPLSADKRALFRGRRRLARHLGVPVIVQEARDAAWLTHLVARFLSRRVARLVARLIPRDRVPVGPRGV